MVYHRLMLISILTLLLFTMGCFEENNHPGKAPNTIYVDDDGIADYTSIQDAIDAAPDNYTIFVYSGVYEENIFINKNITLIGEDPKTTIINASHFGNVIHITKKGRATIQGFTLCNSGNSGYPRYNAGVKVESNGNNITGNIMKNNRCGIYADSSSHNNFSFNIFSNNSDYGIFLHGRSDHNIIYHNVFIHNTCALRIKTCMFVTVHMNVFLKNDKGMYFCCGARENIAHHNTFINNSIWNADDLVGENQWDDGEEGNYWSDYTGVDENNDGIGDTPYSFTTHGEDRYPLMSPPVVYEEELEG